VEKKVRRHLAHAQKRKGFDWERWNRRWLYDTLALQLLFLKASESMGNHDSEVVGACSVD